MSMTDTASSAAATKVAAASVASDAQRLQACIEAFFWSLRDAGLTVDMVEVVRFSDVEDDRAGDRYSGCNGWASWTGQDGSLMGWNTHVSTL